MPKRFKDLTDEELLAKFYIGGHDDDSSTTYGTCHQNLIDTLSRARVKSRVWSLYAELLVGLEQENREEVVEKTRKAMSDTDFVKKRSRTS